MVLRWVCLGRPRPLEPPLHEYGVCIPGPPVALAPLEETLVALTADTRFLTCPTRASIWCCWYLSCLASSSSLVGGTVAAATLALGGVWFSLSHLIFVLCLSALFKEMHIIYTGIGKAVFDTVPDALLTAMEQAILEKSLFLWGSKFLREFITDLGQESLNPCCKGRD